MTAILPATGYSPTLGAVGAALSADTLQLRVFDPHKIRFSAAGATLRLTLENECSFLKVSVLRAFPLSRPQQYWSVRSHSKEIGMIINPEELDAESRRLVGAELERRYMVSTVQRVLSIKERFGVVDWKVDTQRGQRVFTTRNLRENVLRPYSGQYLFTDVDDNRYTVPDINALDPQSRAWLLRHL